MLQYPHLPPANRYREILNKIEVLALALTHVPVSSQQKQNVFHRQLLKSSLFSARIEGNQLSLAQVTDLKPNSRQKHQLEVNNVIRALQKIPTWSTRLSLDLLKRIHQVAMSGLSPDGGWFRAESTAIYDQFGNIVYLTPSPEEMARMLEILVDKASDRGRSMAEQLISIVAGHYYLEKIHPFLDGNGRTGRVVVHQQLRQVPLLSEHILPLDQYFDDHRNQYYTYLERNSRDIADFTAFFLDGIAWSLEQYLEDIKNIDVSPIGDATADQHLLPRRQEILRIIEDHPYISFDSIARRFPTLSRRTIAYDVAQLVKLKLVIKHGQTRGVVYSLQQ
jgi:Fic family protein